MSDKQVKQVIRIIEDFVHKDHCVRVAQLTEHFAKSLEMDDEEIRLVSTLAFLHDLGKSVMPEHILYKKGTLTDEEFALIKNHPEMSEKLMHDYNLYADHGNVVRAHHENWNGTGYPDRLAGEKIPYYARIIALADVYDALTSERVYRKQGFSHESALAIIQAESGVKFDPDLTQRFVDSFSDPQEIQTLLKDAI